MTLPLFGMGPVSVESLRAELARNHYLGPTDRGIGWTDEFGCLVLAAPTSRMLPITWLELSRWCLKGARNGGSRQWSRVVKWLRANHPATTVVSYSDPAAGHTGALYRACNWLWAPTWHRIVTPPTGAGSWDGVNYQAAKDRWIFPLRRDPGRAAVLVVEETYRRRFPWSAYAEPDGADWSAFRLADLRRRLPEALTAELLKQPYRAQVEAGADPMTGHCYVACEALHHLMGRRADPYFIRHEGGPHWFLRWRGQVVDPTASQFRSTPRYGDGRRAAFLTKKPSKRAQIVIGRLTQRPTLQERDHAR